MNEDSKRIGTFIIIAHQISDVVFASRLAANWVASCCCLRCAVRSAK